MTTAWGQDDPLATTLHREGRSGIVTLNWPQALNAVKDGLSAAVARHWQEATPILRSVPQSPPEPGRPL